MMRPCPALLVVCSLLLPGLSASGAEGRDNEPPNAPAPEEGAGEVGIGEEAEVKDEPAFKRHVFFFTLASAASVNPEGFAVINTIGYRLNLFDSDSPLLGDTYASVALAPYATPAFARGGIEVKVKPLAVLELMARVDQVGYFGNFGNVQSFKTPTAEAGDDDRDAGEARGDNASRSGTMFTLQALAQAKVGPIAVRHFFKVISTDLDLPAGDTAYYDPSLDMLVPDGGLVINTDSDLLFVSEQGLTLGLRHTFISPQFDKADFLPGESTQDPNGPVHRLGPLIAYKFNTDKGTRFDEPTAFALVHWYLAHRYRAGQDSSALIPYVALGFAFSGHLF